ncbi:hypothetical protein BMJ32_26105 [Sinorhizobium medicae]|nr:hypothetical protein BMJ32_26105 [Sinorhizobium medicae]PLU14737.1 hypothetical protein BMJ29_26480 [Sinorhizobium medicae]PLU62364.1 hypothetical protein BMJ22_30200 [Sinorhizobium medicae]PLU75462.1 hypothetical protein BMJ19_33475 [Sinorhizobium medicae]
MLLRIHVSEQPKLENKGSKMAALRQVAFYLQGGIGKSKQKPRPKPRPKLVTASIEVRGQQDG